MNIPTEARISTTVSPSQFSLSIQLKLRYPTDVSTSHLLIPTKSRCSPNSRNKPQFFKDPSSLSQILPFLHSKYSMDVPNSGRRKYSGRIGSSLADADASKSPTEIPEPSPPSCMYACLLENPTKFLYHLPPKFSYVIFFTMPLFQNEMLSKLYTVIIHADGPGEFNEEPLKPFWTKKLPELCSFVALGSHIYYFGGRMSFADIDGIREVCKIPVLPCITKDVKWVTASPMISLRVNPFVSVVGSKIFVSNSSFYKPAHSDSGNAHWGELFDPVNGKSKYIFDPPFWAHAVISVSAALEKPEIILVAFHEHRSVCHLSMYNVESRSWKMLLPGLSLLCHEGWQGKAVTVGNTLYFVDDTKLIAYN